MDLRTQRQFKDVYEAIRALTSAPVPKRRPIGFTANLGADKSCPLEDRANDEDRISLLAG
jgi:hypothetical protein